MTTTDEVLDLQQRVAAEARAYAARRKLTGRQIAGALGWSPMYLSRRLNGQLPFTIADIQQLAKVLDIKVTRLLPRSDDGFDLTSQLKHFPQLSAALGDQLGRSPLRSP